MNVPIATIQRSETVKFSPCRMPGPRGGFSTDSWDFPRKSQGQADVLLKRTSSAAGTPRRNVGMRKVAMVHTYLMAGVAMVMMTCTAMSDELKGYKGAQLQGSISCIHPNFIH